MHKREKITFESFKTIALKHGFALTKLHDHRFAKDQKYLKVIDAENMVLLVWAEYNGHAHIHRTFLYLNEWHTTNPVEISSYPDDFEKGIEKVLTIKGVDTPTILGEF